MNQPKTMRAVQYDQFGPAEVLYVAEGPIPSVAEDGILVKVHGASISGGESTIREGKVALFMGKKFPARVGVDFSGVVEAVGPRTSGTIKPGDSVWGIMPHGTFGAIAEFVSVPESRLALAPCNLGLLEAAALPSVGTTVIRALSKEANLQKGERLLIRGAGGGVGSTAIQYAKSLGAQIVAISGASTLTWLRELGADDAVDHRSTSLRALGRFNVILDTVGTEMGTMRQMLTPDGRMVELGFDSDHILRSMLYILGTTVFGSRRIRAFSNNPLPSEIAQLTAVVEDGVMKPLVDKFWDIEHIVDAYKTVERGGVRGKHVVRIV